MTFNNIKIPSLGNIVNRIKKVLLENLEVDYVLILEEEKKYRSTAISTHFHAHITYIYTELKRAGVKVNRYKIYFDCLLLACEMETAAGASPYPYEIIDRRVNPAHGDYGIIPILEPWRTSACNNKQIMQAVEAAHRYASSEVQERYGLTEGIILPEKEDWNE